MCCARSPRFVPWAYGPTVHTGTSGDTRCRIARFGHHGAARHGARHRHALMAGILAGQAFDSVLIGDASLSQRSMRRVTGPLIPWARRLTAGEGRPPLRITGGQAARHRLPMPVAAQVKSSLLLAAACCGRDLRDRTGTHARPHRAHAARFRLRSRNHGARRCARRRAAQARDIDAGGRFSAAFFMVGASIAPLGLC